MSATKKRPARRRTDRKRAQEAKRGVLVTGATTPIGAALCEELLRSDAVGQVLAVGREASEEVETLPRHPRLSYRQVDLSKPRHAQALLFGEARDLEIEVVVHLSMHRSAVEEGRRIRALNVEALRSMLELSERHPTIRRLVFRSYAEVYQVALDLPTLVTEDHPLNLAPGAPQWIRDRVEADLTACARMGLSPLELVVLRCAEVLTANSGSQLFDYLSSPVCVRPMGYDPMMNVLSIPDAVDALVRAALASGVQGVFNVPGADTLPLSACIRKSGKLEVPLPGAVIPPLYRMRRRLTGAEFSYGMNRRRFHYASVLDGTHAREVLGYVPRHRIEWPPA
ncbi:MAG: NAD-dependent epimerase/dehydratase family protein [Myxococcales bacterium]